MGRGGRGVLSNYSRFENVEVRLLVWDFRLEKVPILCWQIN